MQGKRKALFLILLLMVTALTASVRQLTSGMEFFNDDFDGQTIVTALIPYTLLRPQPEGNRYRVDIRIEYMLKTNGDKVIDSNTKTLSRFLDTDLTATDYPLFLHFATQKGYYTFLLKIVTDGYQSQVYSYFFDAHENKKNFSLPYAVCRRGGTEFVPTYDTVCRDSVWVRQYFPQRMTEFVLSGQDEVKRRFEAADSISAVLPAAVDYAGRFHYLQKEYDEKITLFNRLFVYNRRYSAQEQLLQLRSLIPHQEYAALKQFSDKLLPQAIADFWRRNDPSPGTRENEAQILFYERITYADNNWTVKRYMQGWRTDRGRIFLKYGLPDETEETRFTETWYYHEEDKHFIFYDKRGNGLYELDKENSDSEY